MSSSRAPHDQPDNRVELSPKYARIAGILHDMDRAAKTTAEEKDRENLLTGLERAKNAKAQCGALSPDDACALLLSMLRNKDGLVYEEYITALLKVLDGVPLSHQTHREIEDAFRAALRRGRPVRQLFNMYRNGRARTTT